MGLRGGLSLILRGNLKRDFIRHLKGITLEEEEPYSVGAFLAPTEALGVQIWDLRLSVHPSTFLKRP